MAEISVRVLEIMLSDVSNGEREDVFLFEESSYVYIAYSCTVWQHGIFQFYVPTLPRFVFWFWFCFLFFLIKRKTAELAAKFIEGFLFGSAYYMHSFKPHSTLMKKVLFLNISEMKQLRSDQVNNLTKVIVIQLV